MSAESQNEFALRRKREKAVNNISLNISSKKWLSMYGLKKLRLDFSHILSKIGFKNSEDYVNILKKPVSSEYSNGLFTKIPHKDGMFYNLTASKDSLIKIEKKVQDTVRLYKSRLEWLTSGSRKLFGFIEEEHVCFVIDMLDKSNDTFQFYIDMLITMLKEQLIYKKTFNFIRAGEDVQKWQDKCINVSADTIIDAIDWLLELQPSVEYSKTSSLQTIIDTSSDTQIEAIYICTNGGICTSAKNLILEKVKSLKIPVHVIHFESCNPSDSLFLTELTKSTGGRFLYNARNKCKNVVTNRDSEEFACCTSSSISADVMLIWDELNEAKKILTDLQTIISSSNRGIKEEQGVIVEKVETGKIFAPKDTSNELYISSKDWLKKFGLKKLNLTIQSFLKSSTFDHCCGVIDMMQSSNKCKKRLNLEPKLVDAKYCNKLGHIRCSDGSVKHVQFSESMYRVYEHKMTEALQRFKQRLDWLQNGSRELFGTIIESRVCILVDTSSSMAPRLHVVQEKLLRLFQEQLPMKELFNILHFGSAVHVWKNNLTSCTPQNLCDAWNWVQRLEAGGSTNTFAAIKAAYLMEGVEALYLLTDGRPDQPSDVILSQVSPSIPIHPIAFNCDDDEANLFLSNLASRTRGRYHKFFEELVSKSLRPSPYESEDLSLLRREIISGLDYMKQMNELRNRNLANPTVRAVQREKSLSFGSLTKQSLLRKQPKTSLLSEKMPECGYLENRTSLLRKNSAYFDKEKEVPEKDDHSVANQDKTTKQRRRKLKDVPSKIRRWLKKNGLVAQQLTIFDALAPTMVEQKGKYVPSLGKEVLSKVFGDVFPIMHGSSKGKRDFKIVNPQALNLIDYEENLEQSLKVMESKLESFILSHLSDGAKESCCGKSAFDYLSNKEVIQDLEENNLTGVVKDARLLEREIKRGKAFLNQSEDLREIVKQHQKKLEARKNSKDLKLTKVSSKKENIGCNRRDSISNHTRIRYHRILARSDVDGFYYPAIVNRYVNSRYINVLFDNGEEQLVSVRYVISLGGCTACPSLSVGDYVLVSSDLPVRNAFTTYFGQSTCYLPGVVQVTPLRMKSASKYYTVVQYNGRKLTALRKDMYKISHSRYIFSVRFIQEVNKGLFGSNPESFGAIIHQNSSAASSRYHSKILSLPPSDDSNSETEDESPMQKGSCKIGKDGNQSECVFSSGNEATHENLEADEKAGGGFSMYLEKDAESSDSCKTDELICEEKVEPSPKVDEVCKFEEWKHQFENDFKQKLNELEEQKNILLHLEEHLKENESKQDHQKYILERQMQQLQLAQEQHLVNMIKQANQKQQQMKDEYKDLSHQQDEVNRCQREQQKKLIQCLLRKQEQYEEIQNSLRKVVYMKDEHTITEDLFESFPDDELETNVEIMPPRICSEKVESSGSPIFPKDASLLSNGDNKVANVRMFVSPESESILMEDGESGIYLSRSPLYEDPAILVQKLPNLIRINQEVLARFKDDGWYYRGTIRKVINDSTFVVEDGVGDMEEVIQEDVLIDADDAENVISIGDYVVGLHPKYQYAYSPGLVLAIEIDGALKIQFYDMQTAVVPRVEAYLISSVKFECDCSYIRQCEDLLIGQSVVCRDNETGIFHLGEVRDRVNGPRNYLIEWPDHSLDIQNYAFIFGSHSKRRIFQNNSCILAMSRSESFIYLPGRVLECNGDTLVVEFCDMTRVDNINGVQSFWISPDYYENAVKYWQVRNSSSLMVQLK